VATRVHGRVGVLPVARADEAGRQAKELETTDLLAAVRPVSEPARPCCHSVGGWEHGI
jgi:hypothetical protein